MFQFTFLTYANLMSYFPDTISPTELWPVFHDWRSQHTAILTENTPDKVEYIDRYMCVCVYIYIYTYIYIYIYRERERERERYQELGHSYCIQKLMMILLQYLYYPCNRPWRLIRLWNVMDPTFSRQSAHTRWLGCQPYAPAALYSQKYLLVLISVGIIR
jgi:hypothetical protein